MVIHVAKIRELFHISTKKSGSILYNCHKFPVSQSVKEHFPYVHVLAGHDMSVIEDVAARLQIGTYIISFHFFPAGNSGFVHFHAFGSFNQRSTEGQ